MRTRPIRWPLVGLFVFIPAACLLVTVSAYLILQRWGRGTPRPDYAARSADVAATSAEVAATSVEVVAVHPDVSAKEVERKVIIPLEVTFAGTPGLKSVRGKSQFGLAYLRLEFESRMDYSQARQEVLNRLPGIDKALPTGVIPIISPVLAEHELLRYILRGPKDAQGKDIYTAADLRALQDWVLEREFRRVPRVIDVAGAGGAVPRYEVHLDPDRLRRYGITLRQVQTAIGGGVALNARGLDLFGGETAPVQYVLGLKDPHEAAARLRAGEQHRLREIRSLVIPTVNAEPVRLEDVVEGGRLAPGEEVGRKGVVIGLQPGQGRISLSRPGEADEDDLVLGVVFLRPGEDRQAALDDMKAKAQEINDTPGFLLPGVRLEPLWDRAGGGERDVLVFLAAFPANVSAPVVAETMGKARAVLLHYPEVRAVLSEVGPDNSGSDRVGVESVRLLALLHPERDQPRSRRELRDDVQAELSRSLAGIDWDFLPDGMDDFQSAFDAAPGGGLLKIFGPDLDELERLAGKAQAELRKLEGVSDVRVRHILGKSHLEFSVDADKCARWGVSVADVNNLLTLAVGGQRVTRMIEGRKTFDLTLLWPEPRRRNVESILDIPVDAIDNMPAPGEAPPIAALSPRLRLRDLVPPQRADGRPNPQGASVRPGITAIWREQGRRMIAVRFRIRNRKEADVAAEAERTLAPLFSAPYRAEWSVRAVMPRGGALQP
jgi:Cu/Ag efflux pump CusA